MPATSNPTTLFPTPPSGPHSGSQMLLALSGLRTLPHSFLCCGLLSAHKLISLDLLHHVRLGWVPPFQPCALHVCCPMTGPPVPHDPCHHKRGCALHPWCLAWCLRGICGAAVKKSRNKRTPQPLRPNKSWPVFLIEPNQCLLRYADDTTLMAESEEELKSLLIKGERGE